MRHPLALAAVLLLAAALPVTAQEDCSDPETCPWTVSVDETGFIIDTDWTFTQDEWANLTVENTDEAPHTVTLSGYGVTVQVAGDDEASVPIQFTQAGTFTLTDSPTGKTATFHVVAGDAIDEGSSSGAAGAGTGKAPGLGLPALLLGLAAVGVAVRRHRLG